MSAPRRPCRPRISSRAMLELDLELTAGNVLDECQRRGLVVRSERELAGRSGSRHWHLGIPGRPGTLELSECEDRVWLKVHPLRDGGWATAFARELSAQRARPGRYVGTSGFSYASWKPDFYPAGSKAKDFLRLYSQRLPSVELNATFYRLPSETQLRAWADQTPP